MVKVSAKKLETNSLNKFLLCLLCCFYSNPLFSRYNVPRSFLKPTENLLVVLEEEFGDPLRITLGSVSITKVCGHVSESHFPPVLAQSQTPVGRPKVQLHCHQRRNISRIMFASFGNPTGDCHNYATGNCHLPSSRAIVEKVSLISSFICD